MTALTITKGNVNVRCKYGTATVQDIVVYVKDLDDFTNPGSDLSILLDESYSATDVCLVEYTAVKNTYGYEKSYSIFKLKRDYTAKTVQLVPMGSGNGEIADIKKSILDLETKFATVEDDPAHISAVVNASGWEASDLKFASRDNNPVSGVAPASIYSDTLVPKDFFGNLDADRTYRYEFSYMLDASDWGSERFEGSPDLMPLRSEGIFFVPNPFNINSLDPKDIPLPKGKSWDSYLGTSLIQQGILSQNIVSSGFPEGQNTVVPDPADPKLPIFKGAPTRGMFSVYKDPSANALGFIENKNFSMIKIRSSGTIWKNDIKNVSDGGVLCINSTTTMEFQLTKADVTKEPSLLRFSTTSCYRKPYLNPQVGALDRYFRFEFRDGAKVKGFPSIGGVANIVQPDLATLDLNGSIWLNPEPRPSNLF